MEAFHSAAFPVVQAVPRRSAALSFQIIIKGYGGKWAIGEA